MVGDLRKFFRKLFRNTGCATLRRNVQHSLTSFCTTLSYRVAVHVFLGTRAQVYTRDATHRPTATSTPGRGAFLQLLFEEIPGISRNLTNFRKK